MIEYSLMLVVGFMGRTRHPPGGLMVLVVSFADRTVPNCSKVTPWECHPQVLREQGGAGQSCDVQEYLELADPERRGLNKLRNECFHTEVLA